MNKYIEAFLAIVLVLCISILFSGIFYGLGETDGCHDVIDRLNDSRYDNAAKGVGLSPHYWCDVKRKP